MKKKILIVFILIIVGVICYTCLRPAKSYLLYRQDINTFIQIATMKDGNTYIVFKERTTEKNPQEFKIIRSRKITYPTKQDSYIATPFGDIVEILYNKENFNKKGSKDEGAFYIRSGSNKSFSNSYDFNIALYTLDESVKFSVDLVDKETKKFKPEYFYIGMDVKYQHIFTRDTTYSEASLF